jgi:CubicO group peptidase (beta-lactamase class C family)
LTIADCSLRISQVQESAVRRVVLAVVLSFHATIAAGQPPRPATEWLADPSHAAKIAAAERDIVAVIPGEAEPLRLSLHQWMERFKVPGLSIAVFDQHRLVWAKAYGVKEAGQPDPVTLDTLFQAGSISKPVTAMAALHFVEKGRWSLDEPINDRLVSWKVPPNDFQKEQKVTLRRLLSHNAGMTVHGFPG